MLSILFYLTRSDMIEDNMIRLKEGHEAAAFMPSPAPNMPKCHHWQVCVCVVCVCVVLCVCVLCVCCVCVIV